MKVLGHDFRPYGSEEMICRQCDYVIGVVTSVADAEGIIRAIAGGDYPCPGQAGDDEIRVMAGHVDIRAHIAAQRIEARSDETPKEAVQPEGREPGPKDAPKLEGSNRHAQ